MSAAVGDFVLSESLPPDPFLVVNLCERREVDADLNANIIDIPPPSPMTEPLPDFLPILVRYIPQPSNYATSDGCWGLICAPPRRICKGLIVEVSALGADQLNGYEGVVGEVTTNYKGFFMFEVLKSKVGPGPALIHIAVSTSYARVSWSKRLRYLWEYYRLKRIDTRPLDLCSILEMHYSI
ncbi:hypothetical protein NM688_g3878 [Phlebia brevispora]|uniref:Uncharacterized protein n=1 Tax=Phlebia brevispora TaxID=194682 RepID=A0ACC1T4H2_9APHY|nr:hypothetical protein NM688_g3878 [Phlebia brevispora]